LHVRETGVQAVLEVRGPDHTQEIISSAKANGFEVSETVSR